MLTEGKLQKLTIELQLGAPNQ